MLINPVLVDLTINVKSLLVSPYVNLRVVNSVLDKSPLELAVQQRRKRVYAILLNAGATIP